MTRFIELMFLLVVGGGMFLLMALVILDSFNVGPVIP